MSHCLYRIPRLAEKTEAFSSNDRKGFYISYWL